jgi:hypothetical protein
MAVNLNELTGPQRKLIRDAFMAAFTAPSLDLLLQDELDRPPLASLVPQSGFEVMLFDLINVSRRNGWTQDLIEAAERGSENSRIKALRQTLETSALADLAGTDSQVRKAAPASGGLERMVRTDSGYADLGLWVERMTAIGRWICRIEYPIDLMMGGGTGVLVAPDLVLTNYHVIEKHEKGQRDPLQIRCRFDFAVGAAPSAPVALTTADWLVDFSCYSSHDPGDKGGPPTDDELDYALLRLASPVGNDAVGTSTRRWLELTAGRTAPGPNAIVFVAQHPGLEPLKLAVGKVLTANANGTRLRYDTNTERGSSGSPCFDVALNPFALHHAGDPDYTKLVADYNQGIPLTRILQRMAARGVKPFWK